MNKKILTLSLLILLITMCVTGISASTVKAQSAGSFIKSYTIKDATTGDILMSKNYITGTSSSPSHVSEGEEIACTATITISVNNPSTSLTLGTGMAHPS